MSGQNILSSNITSDDLVKVIEACHRAGVSQIIMGGVSISFVPNITENLTDTSTTLSISTRSVPSSAEQDSDASPSREEEMDHFLLSDPVKYEEMVLE